MKKNEERAIALKYEKEKARAPKIVAKGKGDIARKIKKIANENNVPLYQDKDLSQLLEALDIDREIPENLYKAVAEVLAFVYKLNKNFNKKN